MDAVAPHASILALKLDSKCDFGHSFRVRKGVSFCTGDELGSIKKMSVRPRRDGRLYAPTGYGQSAGERRLPGLWPACNAISKRSWPSLPAPHHTKRK